MNVVFEKALSVVSTVLSVAIAILILAGYISTFYIAL